MRAALLLAAVLLWSAAASAQTLYGTLVGNVIDETGLPVPGATVKITHAETNQSREAVTSSGGGYNFPNIPTGTYQVDVALTGFQSASSRGVEVRQSTSVRVDVRLTVGALQETVLVSGTAAVLQTESAAVQMQTTSEQIVNLPTAGRSYQSFIGLMPGVAAPYMIQAGGINNPARSMGVSVNGQPPNNTLFRVDGAAVTNQWYPDIQSYSPALEAVETVSVVTNSFDADQGMAGGAAVNVQVKSGTNTISGSLFEYLTDSALKNRPYFLPEGTDKGKDTKNIFGGTLGGPIVRNRLFFFVSVESEVRRVKDGTVQLAEGEVSTGTTGLNTLPPASLRAGNFSDTNTVIYDPLTGTATGTGRVPFAFANCPGLTSTTDPRFRELQLHPGEPHQFDLERHAVEAHPADAARFPGQLLRAGQLRVDAPQDRHEDDLDAGEQAESQQPPELAGEPAEQPRHLPVARRRRVQPAQHRPAVARQHHERLGSGDVDSLADVRHRRRLRLHAVPQLGRAGRSRAVLG